MVHRYAREESTHFMPDRAFPRRGERTLASRSVGTAGPWVAVGRRRVQRRERALTNLVRVASGPARRVGTVPPGIVPRRSRRGRRASGLTGRGRPPGVGIPGLAWSADHSNVSSANKIPGPNGEPTASLEPMHRGCLPRWAPLGGPQDLYRRCSGRGKRSPPMPPSRTCWARHRSGHPGAPHRPDEPVPGGDTPGCP